MQVQPAATIVIAITGIQNMVFEMRLATLGGLGAARAGWTAPLGLSFICESPQNCKQCMLQLPRRKARESRRFWQRWMVLVLELLSLRAGVWMQEGSRNRIHPGGELDGFLA